MSSNSIRAEAEPEPSQSYVFQDEPSCEQDNLVSSAEESEEQLASDVTDSKLSAQGQSGAKPDMRLSAWAPDESVERIRAQNKQYLESTNGSESRRSYQY